VQEKKLDIIMGDARTLSLMESGVKLPFERVILRQKLVTTEIVVPKLGVLGAGWPKKIRPAPKIPKILFKKILGVGTQFGDSVASKRPKSGGSGRGEPRFEAKIVDKAPKMGKKMMSLL
jgi:hypothetical protein